MPTSHILIICPDDKNAQLVQETGQLAMVLQNNGIKISILGSSFNKSPFDLLIKASKRRKTTNSGGRNFPITLYQNSLNRIPWSNSQTQALQRILQENASIEAVHLMDITPNSAPIADICLEWEVAIIGHIRKIANLNWAKQSFWKRKTYKKQLQIFNPIIVSTAYLLEAAKARGLEDVVYIPEGIQTSLFKPVIGKRPVRRKLRIPEKPTIACCMASIKPENRQLETFQLCQPLSQSLHLLFIGEIEDNNYFNSLKKTIKKLNMEDCVTFRRATDCPEEYLKSSDLFILLGGIEERRNTILEAQSTGLPVILGESESSLALTNGRKNGIIINLEKFDNNADGNIATNSNNNSNSRNSGGDTSNNNCDNSKNEGGNGNDSGNKSGNKNVNVNRNRDKNPQRHKELEKLLTEPAYRQTKAVNSRKFIEKDHSISGMVEAYLRLHGGGI